jgi:hypothetical protein
MTCEFEPHDAADGSGTQFCVTHGRAHGTEPFPGLVTICGRCGSHDQRPTTECPACFPWSRVLTCCHLERIGDGRLVLLSCGRDAEFEVRAVRPTGESPFVGIAGPDMYSDDTYACEEHVGNLLGHQPDAHAPEQIYWHVRSLDPSEVGTLDGAIEAA